MGEHLHGSLADWPGAARKVLFGLEPPGCNRRLEGGLLEPLLENHGLLRVYVRHREASLDGRLLALQVLEHGQVLLVLLPFQSLAVEPGAVLPVVLFADVEADHGLGRRLDDGHDGTGNIGARHDRPAVVLVELIGTVLSALVRRDNALPLGSLVAESGVRVLVGVPGFGVEDFVCVRPVRQAKLLDFLLVLAQDANLEWDI